MTGKEIRDQFFLYISTCLSSWETVLAFIHPFTHSFIEKCKLNFHKPHTALVTMYSVVNKRDGTHPHGDNGMVKEPDMKQVNKGLTI